MTPTPATATYWFPAEGHGWGWPQRWQGHLVLALFTLGELAVYFGLPLAQQPGALGVGMAGLLASLLAVCWFKGEPLRWRTGR